MIEDLMRIYGCKNQRQLAKKLNIPEPTISRWKKKTISFGTSQLMIKLLEEKRKNQQLLKKIGELNELLTKATKNI